MSRAIRNLGLGIGSLAMVLLLLGPAQAQNFETALDAAADALAASIEDTGRQRVAVIDFDQIEGQITALGRFLAEEISASLAGGSRAFKVINRANLQSILAEHALSMSGLVNPENAKRLGQIAGVDALVLGTYTDFGESYRLSLQAIATDSAEVVATARSNLPKTKALEQLAGTPVEQREPTRGAAVAAETQGGATMPPVQPEPASPSAGSTSPGLLLEIYLIEERKFPEKPTGLSLALFDDTRPPSFSYAAVLEERQLEPHQKRRLGLHWTGHFTAKESGRHVFSVVVNHEEQRKNHCRGVSVLAGKELFNGVGWIERNSTPLNGEIILQSGLHPFEFWMVCDRLDTTMGMTMRGPSDRQLAPVPSDRFSHALDKY